MKIGLTICEYNPFHNGHLYSLSQINEQLNPDFTVVIMSGNFTQRGEIAVMHKYLRARHAVLAGADLVIELPTVFATAPAEIFAKGAVKLLNGLKGDKTLCFGVESGDKSGLIATATALSTESEHFKEQVKLMLKKGYSLAKAKHLALENLNLSGVDANFTKTPNNILALEYTKAIIQKGYDMDILPILRKGAGYKECAEGQEFSSAMGIRTLIQNGEKQKCKPYLPPFVYQDLPNELPNCDDAVMISLINSNKDKLSSIIDCTEGLENRIKDATKTCRTRSELIECVSTKRYPQTRISRITLSSLLEISNTLIQNSLKSNLYLKVLAVNGKKLNLLSSVIGNTPLIMRKSDLSKIKSVSAKKCFELDVKANDIYNQITKIKTNEFYTQIIKK